MSKEYKEMKEGILAAIEHIRKFHPEAAKHLTEKLIMNDEEETFCYTGKEGELIMELIDE